MKAKQLLAHPATQKFTLLKGDLIANIFVNKTISKCIVEHKENGQIPYRGNPNAWVITGDIAAARRHYESLTSQGYKDQQYVQAFELGYDDGWNKRSKLAKFSIPFYCKAYEAGYKEGAQDEKDHEMSERAHAEQNFAMYGYY